MRSNSYSHIPAVVVLWFACTSAHSQSTNVAAIDVYGTDALDIAKLQSEFGDDIDEIAAAQRRGDLDSAAATEQRVVEQLLARGDFASVHLSLLNDSGGRKFALIDVVETADSERRAPFKDSPKDDFLTPVVLSLSGENTNKIIYRLRCRAIWRSETIVKFYIA